MARPQPKRAPKEAPRRSKKVCQFCKEKTDWIDYKDINLLRRFMSDRGKIRARRVTGNCAQHQRDIANAIKTSREVALLPYTQRTTTERASRGPRPDRRRGDDETPSAAEQLGVDLGSDGDEDEDLVAVGAETEDDN
jgi:small subunit ribosomal protein S18